MQIRLNNQILFLAVVAAMALVALLCGLAIWRYLWAKNLVESVKLEARSANGAIFFAAPKRVFVGQELSRNDVISHLRGINFIESGDGAMPGTFQAEGKDTMRLTSRMPELPSLILTFKGRRLAAIATIQDEDRAMPVSVPSAMIEPETLSTFVQQIDSTKGEPASMFVRRYVIQWGEIEGTALLDAILVREDESFFEHHGIRYLALLRALFNLGSKGGGSTITQQVVKNAVSLDWSRSIWRKLDEAFIAAALEDKYSKREIFTHYANTVFLGNRDGINLYGFAAAAKALFGKSVKSLSLQEAAALASLVNGPNRYLRNAEGHKRLTLNRDRALEKMGRLWPARYPAAAIEEAKHDLVEFAMRSNSTEKPLDKLSQPYVELARSHEPLLALKELPPQEYAGLHVYCTVDSDLMRAAQQIISRMLPRLERQFPVRNVCAVGQRETTGKEVITPNRMLGGIIALGLHDGSIIAMYGGSGGKTGGDDAKIALNAKIQPASTFKPFLQAKVFELGLLDEDGRPLSAESVVDARVASLSGWRPEFGVGGPASLRVMLAHSRNDYAAYLVSRIGLQAVARLFEDVSGNRLEKVSSEIALGLSRGMELSPLRLAQAYTAFGRGTMVGRPRFFSNVYSNGREVPLPELPAKRLFDVAAARQTMQMMRAVLGHEVNEGHPTGLEAFRRTGLSHEEIVIGAKTGSGPSMSVMVSVSPRLVVLAFTTYFCPPPTNDRPTALRADKTASMLWSEFILSVKKHRPDLLAGKFEAPAGVAEF